MGLNLGVMSAAVVLDDSDYRKKLSGLEGASENTFKRIAQFAAGYLTGRAIVGFVQNGVQAFANLETACWNFDQVFKEIPASAASAEEEMRRTYKLSETTTKTMLGNAAAQLQAFGFSAQKSLELARKASERGVDLASFRGGNQADAVSAIVKSLTGETESLKRYGIVIQQNSKKFLEMADSIQKTTGCTDLQAKSQAILNEIMEQSKLAEGDYIKEGVTIAQQQMDIAEATIKAKESFGAFLAEGVSPMMETWRKMLAGFAETPPEMQRLEIRTAAAAAAFLMLAKCGLIAKGNMAISGIISSVTAANTALAGSATLAGKAHIFMAAGVNTAKTAMNGLAASLGPIGAAIVALSAAYLAYNYIIDQNNKVLKTDLDMSKSRVDTANAEAEAKQKQRDEEVEQLARLQELSKYERLNNSEMQEAEQIINALSAVYGNLDISIDKTTGKVKFGANAWRELNKEQAKAVVHDLAKQANAQSNLVTAQVKNLRNELSSFWKNTFAASIVASTANLFGSDDYTDGDLAYRAKNSELQQELDRIMKLQTAEQQLSGFENLRNRLYNEGEAEKAKKVEVVISAIQKQIKLEKEFQTQLKNSRKEQDNQKPEMKNKEAVKTKSEAERKALTSIEQREWEYQFNSSDFNKQITMLEKKISDVFNMQSGRFSSIDEFKTSDRSKMNEDELDALNKIIELEQQRADIRKRSANAFSSEKESYAKIDSDRQKRIYNQGVEREIKDAQKKGDTSGVNAIMQRELDRAKQAADLMRTQYEQALKDAEADDIMTEEEKKRLQEMRGKLQEALSDQDSWAAKIGGQEDKDKSIQKQTVAWSSELLNAQIGGMIEPQEATAKNTTRIMNIASSIEKKMNKSSGEVLS